MPRNYVPISDRFWVKVNVIEDGDSCWDWLAATFSNGYGHTWDNGHKLAHKVSWELCHGEIPDGYVIAHKCDRPVCVRPSHLFMTTQSGNLMDCLYKGRRPVGEEHPNSYLTKRDVLKIRELYSIGGVTYKDLAEKFGTTVAAVGKVIRRDTWNHI